LRYDGAALIPNIVPLPPCLDLDEYYFWTYFKNIFASTESLFPLTFCSNCCSGLILFNIYE